MKQTYCSPWLNTDWWSIYPFICQCIHRTIHPSMHNTFTHSSIHPSNPSGNSYEQRIRLFAGVENHPERESLMACTLASTALVNGCPEHQRLLFNKSFRRTGLQCWDAGFQFPPSSTRSRQLPRYYLCITTHAQFQLCWMVKVTNSNQRFNGDRRDCNLYEKFSFFKEKLSSSTKSQCQYAS